MAVVALEMQSCPDTLKKRPAKRGWFYAFPLETFKIPAAEMSKVSVFSEPVSCLPCAGAGQAAACPWWMQGEEEEEEEASPGPSTGG